MTSKRSRSSLAVCSTLLALVWSLGSTPAAWSGEPPTPTETETPTPTDTETPTPTATETETPTPTETETPTPTTTEMDTPTPTPTPSSSEATPTLTPTVTPSPTETETPTPTETETATPTATSTGPTATPTATATATPEPLNHFLCYEAHERPVNRAGVELEDQFDKNGPSTVTVQKAKRLCVPADKNGEDPSAPNDPAHLTAYTIHQTSPRFVRLGPIPVAPDNPILFPMTVTLTRPERLLVPASKNPGTPPPPPLAAPIDHYKCYRVKGAVTRLQGVPVKTQFGDVTVDIKKPLHLCTPVDKNGEGVIDDLHHLLCYQVRATSQTPRTVSTNNQFEQKTFDIFGIRELCVPAFKFPGFCGDGSVNAPGEQCDGSTAGCAANPNETCSASCKCECQPLTTADCPMNACEHIADGCGGTIDCGTCTPPAVCGLLQPNQCDVCPNSCLNGGTLNPDCSCSCPAGYDSVHGGCFRIATDLSFDCGSSGCDGVSGSIDGSGNFLCRIFTGIACSSSNGCPLGAACNVAAHQCRQQCTSP
jgi:hypothetical protein